MQEKHIRNDLCFGTLHGNILRSDDLVSLVSNAPHQQCLVLDTNIMMHQLDILECECPATGLIVVLQTVLQELKHLNVSAYRRVYNLVTNTKRNFIFFPNECSEETAVKRIGGESPNDYNDRLIRVAAAYYQKELGDSSTNTDITGQNVVLLSNDKIQRVCTLE